MSLFHPLSSSHRRPFFGEFSMLFVSFISSSLLVSDATLSFCTWNASFLSWQTLKFVSSFKESLFSVAWKSHTGLPLPLFNQDSFLSASQSLHLLCLSSWGTLSFLQFLFSFSVPSSSFSLYFTFKVKTDRHSLSSLSLSFSRSLSLLVLKTTTNTVREGKKEG